MPDFDWDDFSKPLVDGIAMYNGKWCGIPFDIPIFILMYRKDLFEKHQIEVPKDLDGYLKRGPGDRLRRRRPTAFSAPACQAKSGHYSLECDWTSAVWGHGGSIFDKDKKFVGNDERGVAGLKLYQELVKNSPPSATTWTWDGQGQALTQGQAAMAITWGEDFPGFDANDSKVKGLFEALPAPKEVPGRRAVADCGFNEIPAVGHQGGSTISLSNYSKNKEAAWLFMQWVCSKDVMAALHPRRRRLADAQLLLHRSARQGEGHGRPGHDAPSRRDQVDDRQRRWAPSRTCRSGPTCPTTISRSSSASCSPDRTITATPRRASTPLPPSSTARLPTPACGKNVTDLLEAAPPPPGQPAIQETVRRDLVIGIDCSTSATKAIAWDRDGEVAGAGSGADLALQPQARPFRAGSGRLVGLDHAGPAAAVCRR